jgi:hypothetical protein
MIRIIEELTILKITSNNGLTPKMIYEISQIGNVENAKLDVEAKRLQLELETATASKYHELRKELHEAYVRCCTGYGFNLHLHIGDNPEDVYYQYLAERIASEKEIMDLTQKIQDICVGTDVMVEHDILIQKQNNTLGKVVCNNVDIT